MNWHLDTVRPGRFFTERKLAELRFSQICGTTLRMAIENARMEEAQGRLKRGEAVNDIVKAMGFTSANQFYRIYKRHFGHTIRHAADKTAS